MKKIIFLFFINVVINICNVFAMYQEEVTEEGWTIIKSPLKGTGVKLYLVGGIDSEEVVIDVERSLDSTNYSLMKCLHGVYNLVSGLGADFYGVNYYQLFTMLAFAGKMPCRQQIKDAGFLANVWWVNYVHFENGENYLVTCVNNFKKNFPKCKRIKLQLYSLRQEIILEGDDNMDALIEVFDDSGLEFVGLFCDLKED